MKDLVVDADEGAVDAIAFFIRQVGVVHRDRKPKGLGNAEVRPEVVRLVALGHPGVIRLHIALGKEGDVAHNRHEGGGIDRVGAPAVPPEQGVVLFAPLVVSRGAVGPLRGLEGDVVIARRPPRVSVTSTAILFRMSARGRTCR